MAILNKALSPRSSTLDKNIDLLPNCFNFFLRRDRSQTFRVGSVFYQSVDQWASTYSLLQLAVDEEMKERHIHDVQVSTHESYSYGLPVT